jgi:hypothetical protein
MRAGAAWKLAEMATRVCLCMNVYPQRKRKTRVFAGRDLFPCGNCVATWWSACVCICVSMCVYVYLYMYVHVYVHVYTDTYTCVNTHTHTYTRTHTHTHTHIHIYKPIRVYALQVKQVLVYMCVYIYACLRMQIYNILYAYMPCR